MRTFNKCPTSTRPTTLASPVIDLDGEFIGMAVEHGARHALKLMLSSVIGLPVSDDEIGRVPFVDGRWVIGARSRQNPV
jgi:hypothetical protein